MAKLHSMEMDAEKGVDGRLGKGDGWLTASQLPGFEARNLPKIFPWATTPREFLTHSDPPKKSSEIIVT